MNNLLFTVYHYQCYNKNTKQTNKNIGYGIAWIFNTKDLHKQTPRTIICEAFIINSLLTDFLFGNSLKLL